MDELTCQRLWGFECNLVLQKSNQYVCPEEDHSNSEKFAIISKALSSDFDPFLVGDVINGEKRLEPNHELIKFLSAHQEGRRFAIAGVNVPAYSVEQVSVMHSSHRLTEIASAPNTPEETLDYLGASSSLSVRLAVARNVSTPDHTLSRMYKEGPFEIFLALAENASTPSYILLELAQRHRNAVGKQLAQNPSVTEEIASFLIKAEDSQTRIVLASSGELSIELKKSLCADDDWRVRYALGRAFTTEKEILDTLIEDNKEAVRSAVACNSSASVDQLEKLALEEPYVIRYRLAQNQNLPLHLFAALINDPIESVRRVVSSNPYSPFFYDDTDMEHVLASNPEYTWTSLLSSTHAPESIKAEIRGIAHTQKNVAVSEFGLPDKRNLFLLADLIADGRVASDLTTQYNLVYHLCHFSKDIDRLEEFVFFVLQEHDYNQAVRIQIRNIIISNIRDSGTRLQAILKHTAGVY